MKAGRELDTLVAEKVMGWEATADGLYWDARQKRTRLVLGSAIAKKREEMGIENGPGFVFAPSTDIAAAWEVVEKADLWSLYGSIGDGPYRACIQFEDREGLMTADTAPLAICLAALKAKGVTGEQHG